MTIEIEAGASQHQCSMTGLRRTSDFGNGFRSTPHSEELRGEPVRVPELNQDHS